MEGKKISQLTPDISPTTDDFIVSVDGTTMQNKRVDLGNLPVSNPTVAQLNGKVNKAGDTMTGELMSTVSTMVAYRQTRGDYSYGFGAGSDSTFTVFGYSPINATVLRAFPGGISLGSATNPNILYGTGFPNGVVSAPVGSIYIDENITNGASSWIKTSGTGNTGWVVENGDTGSRNINSLLEPGALVQGSVIVRLKSNTVSIYFQGVEVSSGSPKTILANISTLLGAPFNPAGLEQRDIPNLSSTASIGKVVAGPSEGIRVIGSTGRFWMAFTYTNNNTGWPTTLPGTPV